MIINIFKKISTVISVILLLLIFCPLTHAKGLDSPLDAIKSANPNLIDYSTPEGEWGSLTSFWVNVLKNFSDDIPTLAGNYESEFTEIMEMDDILSLKEAEKTQASTDKEIKNIDREIKTLKKDIKIYINDIKDDIKSKLEGVNDPKELTEEEIAEGTELLFNEVYFYINYTKWGKIPLRIQMVLEKEGYENISQLAELAVEELRDEMEELMDNDHVVNSEIFRINQDDITLIINEANASRFYGESQINKIIQSIANTIRNLIGSLAIIWIIISGIRMIFAQGDETIITEQKRSITFALIGLVIILLIERIIDVIYGPAGTFRATLQPQQAFSDEVYGFINFIKAIIGTIAIFMIVISGVKTITAQGEEEVITKQKKSILFIGIGLILMIIDKIIVDNIFILPAEQSDRISTSNITTLIDTFGRITQFILGFVGIVALGVLIYGTGMMIANYGNDEIVQKSKKIMKNAIIGIIVVISAYTIVATLIVFK